MAPMLLRVFWVAVGRVARTGDITVEGVELRVRDVLADDDAVGAAVVVDKRRAEGLEDGVDVL